MTNDPIIKIEQLEKSFGDLHVLKGIDLEVNSGEVVCSIGASGCIRLRSGLPPAAALPCGKPPAILRS